MRRAVLTATAAGILLPAFAPIAATAAVTASVVGGQLTVVGDAANNAITLRLQPGDPTLLHVLSGGSIVASPFDRATFTQIDVAAGDGHDDVRIDEANGEFTDSETTTLRGENGADYLLGGKAGETLDGGPGDGDFLAPGRGNNTVDGGTGRDSYTHVDDVDVTVTPTQVTRGGAVDTLADVEDLVLWDGAGGHVLDAGAVSPGGQFSTVNLRAGGGADTLVGAGVPTTFAPDTGDDAVTGNSANDALEQDFTGSVTVTDATFTGAQVGNDTLTGVDRAQLRGFGGDNVVDLRGFSGPADVHADGDVAAAGDDTVVAGPGGGHYDAGPGDDRLEAQAGGALTLTDVQIAGALTATLAGFERATLKGGTGADTLDGQGFTGPLTLTGGGGDDTLAGGPSGDVLTGGSGRDALDAGAGDDRVEARDDADDPTPVCGAGDDALVADRLPLDAVATGHGCEAVDRPAESATGDPPPDDPPAPDTSAPPPAGAPPAAAPGAATTPPAQPAAAVPPAPAKLQVERARLRRGRLDVLARITRLARGHVRGSFRAAGRVHRFIARIDRGTIRVDEQLPAVQRRVRTGIVELRWAGTAAVRPDEVRVRAADQPARLRRRSAALRDGVLSVSGTVSRRARGVVRVRLGYLDGATLRFWHSRARIRGGRWSLVERLPQAARGGGQLSIQFTGLRTARGGPMRGEQDAKHVAPLQ